MEWRQAQLCARHGLFEVTGGIYQVRTPIISAGRKACCPAVRGTCRSWRPRDFDTGTTVRLALSNGALIQTENPSTKAAADFTLTLTKPQLLGLLAGHGLDGIEHAGDPAALSKLMGLLDTPDPLPHHHPVTRPAKTHVASARNHRKQSFPR